MEALPVLLHQLCDLVEQFAILLVTTIGPVACLAILHGNECQQLSSS
jgi:hypothetical protein